MEDEQVFTCVSCNQETSDDYRIENNDQVCADCLRCCERCDYAGTIDDDFVIVDSNNIWCESCARLPNGNGHAISTGLLRTL